MIDFMTNPFRGDRARPLVVVARKADAYAAARAALAGLDLSAAAGRRVLLKPNAGRVARPGDGITTNPEVVAAAIDAFVEAGARAVAVGESPITGVDTLEALRASGIAAVAEARGCPVLDLDAGESVVLDAPAGIAMRRFQVCAAVLDFDVVVSIPVVKTHMHTGVTLAVKNMKGCLWRRSKVTLHMLDPIAGLSDRTLDIAIADMATVLRPHLSLVDATVCMEGLGPSAGTTRRLDLVLAGADAFAVDAVACALMGRRAADVPHLRMGGERGLGVLDLGSIDVEPANWREHAVSFSAPPANLAIKFEGLQILDKQSCSACQSTLLLFLKKYGDRLLDYFPGERPVTIAIGRGHEDVPEGTLCIGNCTARHKGRGVFVPGCPPVGSNILAAIAQRKEGGA